MTTSSLAGSRPDAWAEVRANDGVTRYRRSGAGQVVLLLDAREHPGALWPGLPEALEGGFRLIVPEVPGKFELLAPWLDSFLEGLGSRAIGVVAVGACTIPAFELAMRGMDQLARVVLVPAESPGEAAEGTMHARLPGSPIPTLVVRRALDAGDAVPLIRSFLAGE